MSSAAPAIDRVVARAGVHRVAGRRVAVGRERVHEQLVGSRSDRLGSPAWRVRRHLDVIGARVRQGQVDDRRVGVLERVVVVGDRRCRSSRRPSASCRTQPWRTGRGSDRHDLDVDQRAGLGGERVIVGLGVAAGIQPEVADDVGGRDVEDLVGVDPFEVGVGHDQGLQA